MMMETHSEEDANRNVNKYPIVTNTSAVLAVNGALPAAAASSHGNQFEGKDDGSDVDDDDDTEEEQAGEIVGVKVVVRVRPLNPSETVQGVRNCLFFPSAQQILILDKSFEFDHVLPPDVSQKDVYRATAMPLLDKFFKGFNATVFCYGQTGSGKTHTMMGSAISQSMVDNMSGLLPCVLKDIFERMANKPEHQHYRLQLSYLEIYKEDVIDLLRFMLSSSNEDEQGAEGGGAKGGGSSTSSSSPQLSIREEPGKGVCVVGLSMHDVENVDSVSSLLYQGALCRATARTKMNMSSSRSHACCTLYLEGWSDLQPDAPRVSSKYHLVDLAGSERAKRTGAEGQRLKEAITINRGLLALGNVIQALTDESRKGVGHVPYRDAKITRLLMDSLGGSAYTVMVSCISAADQDADETVNTLRYASRARSIRNTATQHLIKDPSVELAGLRKEVKFLQMQLAAQARDALGSSSTSRMGTGCNPLRGGGPFPLAGASEVVAVLREENGRLRERLQELERLTQGAMEESVMSSFKMECMKMKMEQLSALAKEAGVEVPDGLLTMAAADDNTSAAPALGEDEPLKDYASSMQELVDEEETVAGGEGDEDGDGDGAFDDFDKEEARKLVEGELATLNQQIKRKEEAVASISKEEKCMGQLRIFFEGTIERLQTEVKALQTEREQLASALTKTSQASDPSAVSAMRARERELEKKIRELEKKQASYQRIVQLKAKAEEESRKLKKEIAEARQRQGALYRRSREEAHRLCKERRAKELEAVRLKRNESKIKCDYERQLQTYVRQETVLRRKIEEVTAISQRHQETIKRLTEGSRSHHKAAESGFRQQERQKELRRFVQREMDVCTVLMNKRMMLKKAMERRTEASISVQQLNERIDLLRVKGKDAEDEVAMVKSEVQEREKEIDELSGNIAQLQKELLDLETRMRGGQEDGRNPFGSGGASASGSTSMEESESSLMSSTRRWGQIKTLGEARHVLALLFEAAITNPFKESYSSASPPSLPLSSLPAPPPAATARKLMHGGSATTKASYAIKGAPACRVPIAEGKGVIAPAAAAAAVSQKATGGPVPMEQKPGETKPRGNDRQAMQGKEEEEEEEWSEPEEESSSDDGSEDDDDDSDYDPNNSPSRRKIGQRGSREGGECPLPKDHQPLQRKGKDKKKKRGSLEDEIDALLSDADNKEQEEKEGIGMPPLSIDFLEPLNCCTITQLKKYLKAYGLPLSGRKDLLIQRLRAHASASTGQTDANDIHDVDEGEIEILEVVVSPGPSAQLQHKAEDVLQKLARQEGPKISQQPAMRVINKNPSTSKFGSTATAGGGGGNAVRVPLSSVTNRQQPKISSSITKPASMAKQPGTSAPSSLSLPKDHLTR